MAQRKPLSDDAADRPSYLEPAIDAAAMKAFAHPLRMAMYSYLSDHGSATATMLAKHTGESTGQTSYHLRQLERHGFVTDDPTRGTGRERWWKSLGFSMQGLELARDPGTRPAVQTVLRNQVQQQAAALADWYQRAESEDPQWAQASRDNSATMALTLEETEALLDELMTTLGEYADRTKARLEAGEEPDDTRRIRVYLSAFPLAQLETDD